MAAELLSYSYYNHTLNAVYTPLYGNIVEQSLLVQDIAENINLVTDQDVFSINTADDVSKDLYYSIKKFEYEKKYYDNNNITFHLRDRYDFDQDDNLYDSLLNLAVGTFHSYQQLGLLTPFIVDISTVIDGVVQFSFEIDDDYATIDYVPMYTTNIIVPNEILDIHSYVDESCSDIVNAIFIGNSAVSNRTNLLSVVLTTSLTEIGVSAFDGCTSLSNITIPNNMTSIGNYAFYGCSNLNEVTIEKADLPLTTLGSNVFSGCSSSLQIKVPNDRIADYKNMTNWSTYSNKIVPYTNDFTTINMTSSTNTTQTLTLDAGCNKLYKLNVINQGTYDVRASTSTNTTIKLYDSNYNLLETKSKALTKTLSIGIYYVSIAYQSNTQSGTLYPSFKVHSHSYVDHYQWTSMTEHKSYCSCNGYITSSHVVSPDAYQNGNQYAICLLCNGFASFGGTWHDGIGSFPYTLNGSFILPNGVIVLEEADMEAYLNGTLVFINPNDNIDRNNHTEYYHREEECERIY